METKEVDQIGKEGCRGRSVRTFIPGQKTGGRLYSKRLHSGFVSVPKNYTENLTRLYPMARYQVNDVPLPLKHPRTLLPQKCKGNRKGSLNIAQYCSLLRNHKSIWDSEKAPALLPWINGSAAVFSGDAKSEGIPAMRLITRKCTSFSFLSMGTG